MCYFSFLKYIQRAIREDRLSSLIHLCSLIYSLVKTQKYHSNLLVEISILLLLLNIYNKAFSICFIAFLILICLYEYFHLEFKLFSFKKFEFDSFQILNSKRKRKIPESILVVFSLMETNIGQSLYY